MNCYTNSATNNFTPTTLQNMNQTSLLIQLLPDSNHQKQVMDYLLHKSLITNSSQNQPNLHWINEEKESLKIKTVREIISQVSYSSYGNETQFYVLLHADLATIPSQNALLKLIEEPPIDTIIILTATHSEKLLPTIQSRCHCISLQPKHNKHITPAPESEKLQPSLDFFTQPSKTSYADLISLVEPYKNRNSALKLTSSLLDVITKKSLYSDKPIIAKNLLKTHQLLEKNVNVRLALENCFFNIKKSLGKKSLLFD